jgi:hypothetical protein
MNGKSTYKIVPPSTRIPAVSDEWGLYDPNQAGIKAAIRAVRAVNTPTLTDIVPEQRFAVVAPEPVAEIVPESQVRNVAPEPEVRDLTLEVTASPVHTEREEEVYKLADAEPETASETEASTTADKGAVYTLEFPTRCPQCCKKISTVRVSRLLRTQVSFTSTLPRKGYVIVCPECDGMVSAELSGLI